MAFKINVEIPTLLLFFALNFSLTITGNYIIYTTCYVTLGHNETICALLGTTGTNNETAKLEEEVQPYATRISITTSVIETIFSPILCFFLGSWSDKYGRKPVMLIALAGSAVSHLIKCIISTIANVSPWYMIISAIPVNIGGGIGASVTSILCYITDTTTGRERGIKLYVFEGIIGLATVISALTCPLALHRLGYPLVFLISFVFVVIAWIYVFFCLSESVQNQERENKLASLFNFHLFVTSVKAVFKPRDRYKRGMLLVTFSLIAMNLFTLFGLSNVTFLYLRHRFSWALEQCTLYLSIMTVVSIIGGTIGIGLFYTMLRFKESSILLLSTLTCLASSVFQGLSKTNVQMYLSGSLNALHSTIGPMGRSLLSKLTDPEDIGKIFSLLITVEAIFGLLGSLFYTFIYDKTLIFFPASFYFFTAGIYVIDIVLILILKIFQRYSSQLQYTEVSEEVNN